MENPALDRTRILLVSLIAFISFSSIPQLSVAASGKYGLIQQIQTFHYSIDNVDGGEDSYATALGGSVAYFLKPRNAWSAGFKLEFSTPVGPKQNPAATNLFNEKGETLFTLTQGFLQYMNNEWAWNFGVIPITTPLANTFSARMIPYSHAGFDGRYLLNEDSFIHWGHIFETKPNTRAYFSPDAEAGRMERGYSFLGSQYKKKTGLTLQGYFYDSYKFFDAAFLGAEIDFPIQSLTLETGFQYTRTIANHGGVNITNRSAGGDDVDLYIYMLGLSASGFRVRAVVSENYGLDGIIRGYGGVTTNYSTLMISDGNSPFGQSSRQLRLEYNFKNQGVAPLTTRVIFTQSQFRSSRGNDYKSIYADIKYDISGHAIIYLRSDFLNREKDGTDTHYIRLYAQYSF